jgi:hypothetical protein
MPFTTYAELQEEIKSFVWDRADIVAKIPSFISLAEAEMRRLLRTRDTIQQQSFSVSGDTKGIKCDTREVLSVKLDAPQGQFFQENTLTYMTPEAIDEYRDNGPGKPRFYTLLGDRMYFLPTPDQDYTGHIRVRTGFCSLSTSNACNWILERHPDVYLWGALKQTAPWLYEDERISTWNSMFREAIEQANRDMPMRQRDTKLRSDSLIALVRRRDGYGGGGYDGIGGLAPMTDAPVPFDYAGLVDD